MQACFEDPRLVGSFGLVGRTRGYEGVKKLDAGAKFPGSRPQHCHLLHLSPWASYPPCALSLFDNSISSILELDIT